MKYDVCVFGGCSLDETYYEQEKGYNPNPDVIVPGGKGSNQAVAAARAGSKVVIISKVGDDRTGNLIIENLKNNNVDTQFVEKIKDLQNDISQIYIEKESKDNEIKRLNGAIDSFSIDMIEKNKEVILNSDIIVAQLKAPKEVSEYLINFCSNHGKFLVLTPCRPDKLKISENGNKDLIDKISIITANQVECQTIFETTDIDACLRDYPNKLIVTLGSNGLKYCDGKDIIHVPAFEVNSIVDSTGAGDTFAGNFASSLVQGSSFKESIIRGNFASAMKIMVETAQAGMPYKDELEDFIFEHRTNNCNYKEELQLAVQGVKNIYRKIQSKRKFDIEFKADGSPVTEIDIEIEDYLLNEINKKFPNDNFVTEERNPDSTVKNRTWVIDPIDGTFQFIKNNNFWGIQLAFIDEGNIQFSVIYMPKLDELYYAIRGNGAYLNNRRIIRPENVLAKNSCVEFAGSLHKNLEDKKKCFYKLLTKDTEKMLVGNFIHINSCSNSFANLLSGRSDVVIISSTKLWDILPGQFLAEEAGIKEYKIDNTKLRLYSCSNVITKLLTE